MLCLSANETFLKKINENIRKNKHVSTLSSHSTYLSATFTQICNDKVLNNVILDWTARKIK